MWLSDRVLRSRRMPDCTYPTVFILLQAATRDDRQQVPEPKEPVQEPMLISSQVLIPSTCFINE